MQRVRLWLTLPSALLLLIIGLWIVLPAQVGASAQDNIDGYKSIVSADAPTPSFDQAQATLGAVYAAQIQATLQAAQTKAAKGNKAAATVVWQSQQTLTHVTANAQTATALAALPTRSPTPVANLATSDTSWPSSSAPDYSGVILVAAAMVGIGWIINYALRYRATQFSLLPRTKNSHAPRLIPVDLPSKVFLLNHQTITMGRDKRHPITIDETFPNAETVSPQHARLEQRGDRWLIVDGAKPGQVSTKGIFVNNKRTRENFLKDGDQIRLGQVEFTFFVESLA